MSTVFCVALFAIAARTVVACSDNVSATGDTTLAQFTRPGELDVWVGPDGSLLGVISPWGGRPATYTYGRIEPCPVLHIHASINGIEVPVASEDSGPVQPDQAGVYFCALPNFNGNLPPSSKTLEVRVWDETRTWILRGDIITPTATIGDAEALHIGTWADIQVSPVPAFLASVKFDADSGVSSFMYDTNRGGQECETDFVDTFEGGLSSDDAGVPCPIHFTEGGVSIFVPNVTPRAGVINIGGFTETSLVDCEGAATCGLHFDGPYRPLFARFATSVVP